ASSAMVHSVTRRAMCRPVTGAVIAVALVPLLVPEFPALLCLVFKELRAVAVHHALLFVMLAQAIPFGSLMLPFGIFTPISGAAPGLSVAIGTIVRLSGGVV